MRQSRPCSPRPKGKAPWPTGAELADPRRPAEGGAVLAPVSSLSFRHELASATAAVKLAKPRSSSPGPGRRGHNSAARSTSSAACMSAIRGRVVRVQANAHSQISCASAFGSSDLILRSRWKCKGGFGRAIWPLWPGRDFDTMTKKYNDSGALWHQGIRAPNPLPPMGLGNVPGAWLGFAYRVAGWGCQAPAVDSAQANAGRSTARDWLPSARYRLGHMSRASVSAL